MTSKKNISPSQKIKKIIKNSPSVLIVGPMLRLHLGEKMPLPTGIPCLLIDGGQNFYKGKSKTALSLGDNDSSKGRLDILLPFKKDFSDFAFALKNLPSNVKILILKGFLGGRKAHELFNLGEIHHFLESKKETIAFFDDKIMALSGGSYEIEFEGPFSLACLTKTQVSLSGDCDYKTKKTLFRPLSSLGLSNFARGKFKIKTSGPIFILMRKYA